VVYLYLKNNALKRTGNFEEGATFKDRTACVAPVSVYANSRAITLIYALFRSRQDIPKACGIFDSQVF
jgi:hypothetical protein